MSAEFAEWSDVKAKGRVVDPRSTEERIAAKSVAAERHTACLHGHQPTEIAKSSD